MHHAVDFSRANRFGKLRAPHARTKPANDLRAGGGIHDVPHLGLASVALHPRGVSVVGVHLHRQAVGGVDQLNQEREGLLRPIRRDEGEPHAVDDLLQCLSRKRAVENAAFFVFADGQLPTFANRVSSRLLAPLPHQARAAPDGRFGHAGEAERVK